MIEKTLLVFVGMLLVGCASIDQKRQIDLDSGASPRDIVAAIVETSPKASEGLSERFFERLYPYQARGIGEHVSWRLRKLLLIFASSHSIMENLETEAQIRQEWFDPLGHSQWPLDFLNYAFEGMDMEVVGETEVGGEKSVTVVVSYEGDGGRSSPYRGKNIFYFNKINDIWTIRDVRFIRDYEFHDEHWESLLSAELERGIKRIKNVNREWEEKWELSLNANR